VRCRVIEKLIEIQSLQSDKEACEGWQDFIGRE
jgi:hypothetical protein